VDTEDIEVVEEVVGTSGLNGTILLVGGIVIGASVGYFVAKRRLEAKYAQMAEDEIDTIRDLYFEKTKKLEKFQAEKPALEEVVSKYTSEEQTVIDEVAEAEQEELEAEEETEPEIVRKNIFHTPSPFEFPGWDWDTERELRDETHGQVPYVLHRDEYFHNDKAWDQMSLTYFEGDDTLVDDQDTPVDDQDAMVGLGNLTKFGHGSGDPNTVYVRNEELQLEMEIVHSDDKFSEQRRGIPVDDRPRDEHGKFIPQDPRKRRSRGTQ
jgi:gas vesicle protein